LIKVKCNTIVKNAITIFVYIFFILTEKVKFWFHSIKAHSADSEKDRKDILSPPIFLIGTHIDKVSDDVSEYYYFIICFIKYY